MQKKQKHSKHTKLLMRKSALVRDNSNRIKSLPRGNKHWNFKEKPSILALQDDSDETAEKKLNVIQKASENIINRN